MAESGTLFDARSLGQLILDAKEVLDAAERMEEALIDIAAIVMLPLDDGTKLERVRQRVAQGLCADIHIYGRSDDVARS